MSTDRFTEAMGCIDEDLISDAISYMPSKNKIQVRWMKLMAIAACLCLLVTAIFPFIKEAKASPFVLTAYALSSNHTVSSVAMEEGQSIPVSYFEATNGLKGFIFSYEADRSLRHVSVSIMSDGQQGTIDQYIEAIQGLELSKENFYVFYIPPQDQPAPYSLPLTIEDEESNSIALLNVIIEDDEDGYTAKIDSFSIHEKRTEPPK